MSESLPTHLETRCPLRHGAMQGVCRKAIFFGKREVALRAHAMGIDHLLAKRLANPLGLASDQSTPSAAYWHCIIIHEYTIYNQP